MYQPSQTNQEGFVSTQNTVYYTPMGTPASSVTPSFIGSRSSSRSSFSSFAADPLTQGFAGSATVRYAGTTPELPSPIHIHTIRSFANTQYDTKYEASDFSAPVPLISSGLGSLEDWVIPRQESFFPPEPEPILVNHEDIDGYDGMPSQDASDVYCWGILRPNLPHIDMFRLTSPFTGGHQRPCLIGRGPGCDLQIPYEGVSNEHCVIRRIFEMDRERRTADRVVLLDLSRNGTYVNGRLVGRNNCITLRTNDVIALVDEAIFHPDMLRHIPNFTLEKPDVDEDPIEPTFDEEFTICKRLGAGFFAEVFKYRMRQHPGDYVAVKVIETARFGHKPRVWANFEREIGILSTIHHPHAVAIRKVFTQPNQMMIVMDLAEGGDLFERINQKVKFTEDEARYVLRQLLSVLQYLHHRGITHRDIKPENILMTDASSLHVKLTDFGLAKLVGDETFLQTMCGSPSYIAPEVLTPDNSLRAYGTPVDVWSVGVILYILLCGFPPFSNDLAPPSMHEQILGGIYSFQSPYWDHISPDAMHMINKMLEVDPSQRATVDDLLNYSWMKINQTQGQVMPAAFAREKTVHRRS